MLLLLVPLLPEAALKHTQQLPSRLHPAQHTLPAGTG